MIQAKEPTPWRRLFLLFRDRFFESDTDAPGSGFTPNLYQIMGFLATPGLIVGMFGVPVLADMARTKPGPMVELVIRIAHLFLPAYSFAVIAFVTVFEWDTLFPDRRDFLVLGSFPLRLRDLFSAKCAALAWLLGILMLAVNGPPAVMATILLVDVPLMRGSGFWNIWAAQILSAFGAGSFAFFAVAAFQGLLILLLTPLAYRRISPWIQVAGMSFAVASLLLFPVYAQLLIPMAASHPRWLWYFPPFWFVGIYDLIPGHGTAIFAQLGQFAFEGLGFAIVAFAILWLLGFRRHYRRTLESEDTSARKPRRSIFDRWIRSSEELAIFRFSGRILARSTKHKLFLATYISAGLSLGAYFIIGVNGADLVVLHGGLRSLPFLIQIVVLSGFRAGFQYPVDLQANWLFQMTENYWSQAARRVARMRILITGLFPVVMLFIPITAAQSGAHAACLDAVFQLIAGGLLTELLLWTFETVPFTCSYFQGRTNLALLAGGYIGGIRLYSIGLADLEVALEHQPLRAAIYLSAGVGLLLLSWRRQPAAESVRFDASEPVIQTLNLT